LQRGFRFKAAPESWSLYRQWSVTQAVYEAPLRIATTRLKVMNDAACKLRQAGYMTQEREQAFLDESLGVIRTMYRLDSALALREHKALAEWRSNFCPTKGRFSANYTFFYRSFGFAFAERVAALRRTLMPMPRHRSESEI